MALPPITRLLQFLLYNITMQARKKVSTYLLQYFISSQSIFGQITQRPKNQLIDTCFASMDNFPLKRSCNWQADFISRQNTTIYHLFKDTAFNYNMILYFLLTGLSWWIPHLCTSQFTPENEIHSYLAREVVNIDIGMPAMCFVIRSTCKDW